MSRALLRRTLGVGFLTMAVAGVVATPAAAAVSPSTQVLCSDLKHPCSVQLNARQREGAASGITVTGKPGTKVGVRVYRIVTKGADPVGLQAIGEIVPAEIDEDGIAQISYPFTPLPPDQDGGWILASLADTVWTDPADILGSVATFGGRRPTILGDGYGDRKPVGQPLKLTVTNFIGQSVFSVEYRGDDGVWHNVTAPGQNNASQIDPNQTIRDITYTIPQGLASRPYTFRLHNATDFSAQDEQWQAIPSSTALPEPRKPLLVMPPLGAHVAGSQVTAHHPTSAVLMGLGAAAVAGAAALVVWPSRAVGRRRLDLDQETRAA